MELELGRVDARNRYISDATITLSDVNLQPSQVSPFVIQLRPAGGENRYDLFYRYQLDGAIGGAGAAHSTGSLTSPTRPTVLRGLAGQDDVHEI